MNNIVTKKGHIYLSRGNKKLKKTYIFNLPAVLTCNPTAICAKICYALKAERMYPQTKPCRMNNWDVVKNDSSWVHALINKLHNAKHKYLRIHESGDFFSQHYVNQWIAIAQATPTIQFLAFTKRYEWDYSRAPKNLQIVFSAMSDSDSVPQGKAMAYAGNVPNMQNFVECDGQCGPCRKCWNLDKMGKNIRFPIH